MKLKSKWLLLTVVIIIYLFIVSHSFNKGHDDENVYFYMGKLVAEGNMPYKDFFLSHPPLQIFIFALVFKIFGFKLILFKSASVIATIVSAIFFFKLCEKQYNLLAGFFSVVIFLFSHETLLTSTTNLGINIALMFVIIGFYLIFDKKYFISGICLGLASLTSLFALIPSLLFIVYISVKLEGKIKIQLKNLKDFFFGFSLTFILISLILLLVTKGNYFLDVFKYHLLKKPFPDSLLVKLDLLQKMIIFNPFIFAGLIFFRKNKFYLWVFSVLYILFIILLKNTFPYYFLIAFPFLAIITASFISKQRKIIIVFLIILLLLSSFYSINHFISREKNFFKNNEDNKLSDLIKETSQEDDLIFGDYLITPLIALKSDRRIALNFVDTHYLRFSSGLIDTTKLVSDLKEQNLKYFLVTKNNVMLKDKEIIKYLNNSCSLRGNINLNVPTHFTKETIIYPLRIYDCKE